MRKLSKQSQDLLSKVVQAQAGELSNEDAAFIGELERFIRAGGQASVKQEGRLLGIVNKLNTQKSPDEDWVSVYTSMTQACLEPHVHRTEWEDTFLRDIDQKLKTGPKTLSAKQLGKLEELHDKLTKMRPRL